jgi:hypothetical protein
VKRKKQNIYKIGLLVSFGATTMNKKKRKTKGGGSLTMAKVWSFVAPSS